MISHSTLILLQRQTASGQVELVRIPFGHRAIMAFLEYFLVQRQFNRYVLFNTPGWEGRLINVLALGGTFCSWGLRRCVNGWFVGGEFDTHDNELCYESLIERIGSLTGDQRALFYERLNQISRAFE